MNCITLVVVYPFAQHRKASLQLLSLHHTAIPGQQSRVLPNTLSGLWSSCEVLFLLGDPSVRTVGAPVTLLIYWSRSSVGSPQDTLLAQEGTHRTKELCVQLECHWGSLLLIIPKLYPNINDDAYWSWYVGWYVILYTLSTYDFKEKTCKKFKRYIFLWSCYRINNQTS